MTSQDLYNRYKLGIPGAFETVGEADEAILAAIQEALNVNATRLAELEKENQELKKLINTRTFNIVHEQPKLPTGGGML